MAKPKAPTPPKENLFGLLKKYWGYSSVLVLFTVGANVLGLMIPKMIATGIDVFTLQHILPDTLLIEFVTVVVGIFLFTIAQNIIQTLASERVARDMRNTLVAKISRQDNVTVEKLTPSVLLTNLTSDIDAVKMFIAQAVATLVSSLLLIVGSSILLLMTDWKLALIVLLIIPVIGFTFKTVLGKVRVLFIKGQEVIDRLNKVINESILGSSLIRILNSQKQETSKFSGANTSATEVGMKILGHFATLIPVISLAGNMAVLTVVVLGGRFVITGEMTLGSFTAFTSYIGILIFPIIMIGFMSNLIARSTASYTRILAVMGEKDALDVGKLEAGALKGEIQLQDVSLTIGNKTILKNVSFTIPAGTRTALIGPTAAGKTQLLSLLVGLITPTSGTITYDGKKLEEYDKASVFKQIGLVFQQSILFNMSLKENIAFSETVNESDLQKAIDTAELQDFINKQPKKLETIVSERGTSLSGGQKQRLMLARALALNPQLLLLDDFTARVDLRTEKKILDNVRNNYPDITLVSITQKIASVEDYDQILVLMEGELIARGTHKELMKSSLEYIQMYESQKSTSHYDEV